MRGGPAVHGAFGDVGQLVWGGGLGEPGGFGARGVVHRVLLGVRDTQRPYLAAALRTHVRTTGEGAALGDERQDNGTNWPRIAP